jgi:hypothetical protein
MSFAASTDADATIPLDIPTVKPRRSRSWPHIADLALPAAVALWAFGVARTHVTTIPAYGLPPLLPVVFYLGIALLLASAVTELVRREVSTWRMALHATALTVMLYATAPLVYREGRYAWLYKTIGVVQYVNAHGQLNRSIDIYQNWPGFFAFEAWFGRVAGVASPLAYAKWSQLVVELASLPLLYLAYEALSLTCRQRWLALLLVAGSNWIGQDYYSPQALGTLLGLGLMAVALRWLYRGATDGDTAPPPIGALVLVGALFIVLTFTHELSPYLLVVELGALAVFKLLRPRWFPLVLFAIAAAYLIPRFSFVNSHYGLLSSIGNFLNNARPPALTRGPVAPSQQLIERCAEALSLGFWALAAFASWRRRRTGPAVRALTLLAFSPFVMLIALTYGHEGVLRVFLFSLPWSAGLAAMVIMPSARVARRPAAEEAAPQLPAAEAAPQLHAGTGSVSQLWAAEVASQSAAAGVASQPAAAEVASQPAVAETASQLPAAGGVPQLAAARGTWQTAEGGGVSQPAEGAGVSQPAEGGGVSQPAEGGDVSQPAEGAGVSQPAESGDVSQPAEAVGVSQPAAVPRKAWRVTAFLRAPWHRLVKSQQVGDAIRAALALGVAVALFIPAFFGDDSYNFMTPAEVDVVLGFLQTAPPGAVYSPLDNGPLGDTSAYNLFPRSQLFGSYGMFAKPQTRLTADVAKVIATRQWQRNGTAKPAYIVITPSMITYNQQYDVTAPSNFSMLRYSLSHSPLWKLLVDQSGVSIYELVPRR